MNLASSEVIAALGRAPPMDVPCNSARSSSGVSGMPRSTSAAAFNSSSRDAPSPSRDIGGGRGLKIQRADAVRARLQEKGQFIEVAGIYLPGARAELPIEDHAPAPGVGGGVANTA